MKSFHFDGTCDASPNGGWAVIVDQTEKQIVQPIILALRTFLPTEIKYSSLIKC